MIITAGIEIRTELEYQLLNDLELVQGLEYGVPRRGHPEGQVRFHIIEILDMIEKVEDKYSERELEILRFLTIVHDSFKYQVDRTRSKNGENHHGWYARKFAEKHISEFGEDAEQILEMLQWHDEAYLIMSNRSKHPETTERLKQRMAKLLARPIKDWDLFIEFMFHDGNTGNKEHKTAHWFRYVLIENGLIQN